MNLDQAVSYMQGLRRFGVKLGNERFSALLARLGNPHQGYSIAHVAGTKGKGSTTAMIAAILHAHGFRVGSYFSPYVYDVRERVQVDGEMIPGEDFARLVTELVPHVEALSEGPLGQTTEFEMKTAVGFSFFREQQVDFAAIEVGIGGRLDATNVVTPLVSVITNIGLDHTHILGDTYASIAAEKAGIVKPGIPVVTAADEPTALEVIRDTAAQRGSPLTLVAEGKPDCRGRVGWYGDPGSFTVTTAGGDYTALRLRLGGGYQRANAACAIAAIEAMGAAAHFSVRPDAVRSGLARAYLPGRLEVVHRAPTVVMDGAHNDMAAQALVAELARFSRRRLLLVVGMVSGHEPDGVVGTLAPLAATVFATQPTWMRGLPADRIAEAARPHCADVRVTTPPLEAARAALAEAGPDDLVLITGSFYVVGDVPPADLLNR